jgi:hypothetical protein
MYIRGLGHTPSGLYPLGRGCGDLAFAQSLLLDALVHLVEVAEGHGDGEHSKHVAGDQERLVERVL